MDDLARIERVYGSVAEYYRSTEENSSIAYENAYKAHLIYEANRRKIEKYKQDGYLPIAEAFCDIEACFSCINRTEIFTQSEDDDIGTFFCFNKDCEYHKA